MTLRWSDYVLARGDDVDAAWAEAGKAGGTVFILGEGFDPRAVFTLKRLIEGGAAADLSVISLSLAIPGGDSERATMAAANVAELEALAASRSIRHERIPYPDAVHEPRSIGRLLFESLYATELFQSAKHLVVDVSALPTGVYFAIIAGVLDMAEAEQFDGELQVVVAENAELDSHIQGVGVETPTAIRGFSFDVELDPRAARPVIVWAPVIGENALPQLEAIQQALVPDEICPVLPFPAYNPRRADKLLLELRELLIDGLEVEPANFIYADESNPFDLYRGLSRLHDRYRAALQPLGDAAVVVSIHSSKTLSLGALLSAYERRMPIVNASYERHYAFESAKVTPDLVAATRVATLWLFGTPTR